MTNILLPELGEGIEHVEISEILVSEGDTLEKDDIVRAALPDEMLRVFMHYKRDEWEKFLSAVTQWDVDTYLDILP